MTLAIKESRRTELTGLISSLNQVSDRDLQLLERWLAKPQSMWIATFAGAVIAAWGLIPPTLLSESAYLWMITFPESEKHTFVIARRTQVQIQEMLKEYPVIRGHCEVSAQRSIRWLRWMGAKFAETDERGLLEFTIRRADG